MTLDERLHFLVQSTESLHQTAFENTRQIAEHTHQIAELARVARENEKRWARLGRALGAALEAWEDDEDGENSGSQ